MLAERFCSGARFVGRTVRSGGRAATPVTGVEAALADGARVRGRRGKGTGAEEGLGSVDELEETGGEAVGDGRGQGWQGDGGVQARPGRGPILQFVSGTKGAAEIVGVGGERAGDGAAPVVRAFDVQADLDPAGFADGPDFIVQPRVRERDLEAVKADAGRGGPEVRIEGGQGVTLDVLQQRAGRHARRLRHGAGAGSGHGRRLAQASDGWGSGWERSGPQPAPPRPGAGCGG